MLVLDDFLKYFSGAEENFSVYYLVDKRVLKFKKILETRLSVSFVQDEYSKRLWCDTKKQICVHMTIPSLDINSASKRAYEKFSLFMRYYRFLGNRDEEWCGNKCLVKDTKGQWEYSDIGLDKHFYSKDFDDRTLGKNSERIITNLLKGAGRNEFLKIDKIIRTHNTALSSPDTNTAFLNLWSILEIIGVDSYIRDVSKIKQVLNNIIPVLKRNYVNRVIEELHDYLKGNLTSQGYNTMIAQIEETGSEKYKIACFVALKKYSGVRKQTCDSLLMQYPLIRTRIYQLYDGLFKNKKIFVSELNRYGQRLTWHIQRLYRVRNSIIHSGDSNENIVALVEHLHSYVDEIILDIIDRMTRDNSLGTVTNVLMDAKVFIENVEKEYSKEAGFDDEDIAMLMR